MEENNNSQSAAQTPSTQTPTPTPTVTQQPPPSQTVPPLPVQPPPQQPPKPKRNTLLYIVIGILFIIFAILIYTFSASKKENTNNQPPQPTKPAEALPTLPPLDTSNWTPHTVEDITATFKAPPEMKVTSETQKNSETNEPYGLTMYIEKNVGSSDYYQLYGVYEFASAYPQREHTKDLLEVFKFDLQPETIRDTEIAGYPAVEGQLVGERNRYVTYILTPDGMLTFFTAEPTPQNKQITNAILSTLKLKQ